ncbi:MAG: hypothetical protein O9306_06910 [Beijerinckiaceae bacterium]|nr:hypothetical protein [Beijerinckiaceae bacterium]
MTPQVIIGAATAIIAIIGAVIAFLKFKADTTNNKLYYSINKFDAYDNKKDFCDVVVWNNSKKVGKMHISILENKIDEDVILHIGQGVSILKKEKDRIEFSINPNTNSNIKIRNIKGNVIVGGSGDEEVYDTYVKNLFHDELQKII